MSQKQVWMDFKTGACYQAFLKEAERQLAKAREEFFERPDDEEAKVLRSNIRYAKEFLGKLKSFVNTQTT